MEIVMSVAGFGLAGARDETRGGEQAVAGRALMLPDAKVAVLQSETRVGARLQQQSGIMTRRGLRGGSSCVANVTVTVLWVCANGTADVSPLQRAFKGWLDRILYLIIIAERHASSQRASPHSSGGRR